MLLSEAITQARRRADMLTSDFVTDAELISYLNEGFALLQERLCSGGAASADRLTKTGTVTVLAGTQSVALPLDFWILRGVDYLNTSGRWQSLREMPFAERDRWQQNGVASPHEMPPRVYRLIGSALWIWPEDVATGSYRLWYVPSYVDVTTTSSPVPAWANHWEEFAILTAAIKCLQKEESDVSVMLAERAALEQRMMDQGRDRSFNGPARIADVNIDEMAF